MPTPEDAALLAQQNEANAASALSIIRAALLAAEKSTAPRKTIDIADIDFSGVEISLASPITIQASLTFDRLLDETAISSGTLTLNGAPITNFNPIEYISPGSNWNGTAGSGFTSTPVDPTRTTAKPACRLITPPNQYFTDEVLIGVSAGANDSGSLFNNMGLEKVLVHYEGATYSIDKPTSRTIMCTDGKQHTYFGWWVALKHNGSNGHANVYFEAIPRDTTMQKRIIGPYQFSPVATLHDYNITVAATGAIVTGVSYQTIQAALQYLKTAGANNPCITITETAMYDLGPSTGTSPTYQGQGYCTIKASVPVTIGRAVFSTASDARTRYDGMKFIGPNITFDMQNLSNIYHDGSARKNWFDGITFYNSAGDFALVMGGPRQAAWLTREASWLTECTISGVRGPCLGDELVRGCTVFNSYGDVCTGSNLVLGSTFYNLDSTSFASYMDMLSVQYIGAGSTATLAISGNNDDNNRVWTAKVNGTSVGTFTVQNTSAAWTANTNYTIQNVVDWLNSLSGWSATLINNTRRATACGGSTNKGYAMPDTNVKTAPLTVKSFFDLHADWYQQGTDENVVLADNTTYQCRSQLVFFDKYLQKDTLIFNNCFGSIDGYGFTQFGEPTSHMVVVHNSWSDQAVSLRPGTGYTADSYCLLANNVTPTIVWADGTRDPDLVITNNHLFTGGTNPSGGTNTTIGGTYLTSYTDSLAGDFTPIGVLLTNLKTPVVKRDTTAKFRGASAPAGAII